MREQVDPEELRRRMKFVRDTLAGETENYWPSDAYLALGYAWQMILDYENGINWFTNCLNCAKMFDNLYEQDMLIEELRGDVSG